MSRAAERAAIETLLQLPPRRREKFLRLHYALAGVPHLRTDDPPVWRLTQRQRDVVRLACEGLPNKLIAAELGVSMRAVEFTRHLAMRKLGIGHFAGLVRWAVRAGLVEA